MLHARVVGTATSTVKHESLEGWKLLVAQPLAAQIVVQVFPAVCVCVLHLAQMHEVLKREQKVVVVKGAWEVKVETPVPVEG